METKTYMVQIMLQVEVEAFSESDAYEAIEDCFGEGDACGLVVQDFEVLDLDEITG